ncbi:hypothetical protein V492_05919 [Pseudogymnoascus sp. VKM F-4246]|nr:hypothetical protein V492_05919 [Pseudogymnoascus sp. VKM F-4246]
MPVVSLVCSYEATAELLEAVELCSIAIDEHGMEYSFYELLVLMDLESKCREATQAAEAIRQELLLGCGTLEICDTKIAEDAIAREGVREDIGVLKERLRQAAEEKEAAAEKIERITAAAKATASSAVAVACFRRSLFVVEGVLLLSKGYCCRSALPPPLCHCWCCK